MSMPHPHHTHSHIHQPTAVKEPLRPPLAVTHHHTSSSTNSSGESSKPSFGSSTSASPQRLRRQKELQSLLLPKILTLPPTNHIPITLGLYQYRRHLYLLPLRCIMACIRCRQPSCLQCIQCLRYTMDRYR
ncbi:hypothetical protein BDZ89DRAFT_614538 [Hymenopellis radicata]|nr:hypothetical protein BDZ89DRAFT_614538 [Hymenopellis radicata]